MERTKKSTEEVRFCGVKKQPSGKYEADIRDQTMSGGCQWLETYETAEEKARPYDQAVLRTKLATLTFPLGTYETADEAERAYDQAALSMQGILATLNFPHEYFSTKSGGSEKGSPSSSGKHGEVFEIPCLPDEVLEELLGFEEKKD